MGYEDLIGRLQAYYIRVQGAGVWGQITGDITNQTDLISLVDTRVPVTREITINGVTQDLNSDRSWTIATGTDEYSDADFRLFNEADNTKIAAFSIAGVTTGTTRTYTFPNASGTIALTSDLSSYVPYTGATGAVNLGANNLTTTGKLTIGSSSSSYIFNVGSGTIQGYYNPNTGMGKLYIGTQSNHPIGFATNDVERFVIQTNNNLTLLTTLLQFSGTTSAFPALKRSSTELQVRLADDSAFAPLQMADTTINGNLTVDTNTFFVDATNNRIGIQTTSPTARLTIVNSSGTDDGFRVGSTDADSYVYINRFGSLAMVSPTNQAAWGSFIVLGSTSGTLDTFGRAAFGLDTGKAFFGFGSGSGARDIFLTRTATNTMTFSSSADGTGASAKIVMTNTLQINGLTQFAGATSSFPALKRASTELQVRLADDSAFAPIQSGAATINGNLTVDTNTFFVDAANDRVGIGTVTPSNAMTIKTTLDNTAGIEMLYNTSKLIEIRKVNANNRSVIYMYNSGAVQNAFETGSMSYFKSSLHVGGSTNNSYMFEVTGTSRITGNARFDALVLFAGTTSSFPALKPSGTELQVRLADDSAFAPFRAATTIFDSGIIGGTSLNASAIFQVDSTTKGFAPPRMTGAQVEAIGTPLEGLLAYATNAGAGAVTSAGAWIYNGATWVKLATGSTSISIGDTVTSASANQIFYYNGGLAQSSGFEYNSGTTTFLAPNIETSTGVIKSTGTSITFQNGSTSRLIVSSNGVYYAPSSNTNTSYGYTAMMLNTGTENTAFGYQSLMSGSLSGAYNTGFGSSTLRANTTGYSNSAFGRYALYSNTTGYNNMGFGHTALYSNTTGIGNVGIGLDALRKSTTTNYNVAIGTASMYGGTSPSGAGNIAIGYGTLEVYTSADYNIAIGYRGGAGITTGDYNTIVGYRGAFDLTTGSYNTFIGQRDSSGVTTGSYNTIIGHVTGLSSSLANTIIIADGNGSKGIEWSGTRLTAYANVLNITTAKTPASASDTGTTGDIAWDTDYLYVCTATNTWKRAALTTW